MLINLLQQSGVTLNEDQVKTAAKETGLTNKREQAEFLEKLSKLGVLK